MDGDPSGPEEASGRQRGAQLPGSYRPTRRRWRALAEGAIEAASQHRSAGRYQVCMQTAPRMHARLAAALAEQEKAADETQKMAL